ncbi:class II aldolase/adducin family protein [Falsiroseomonas tokyonensis]|uniref:Class II aldolase/adducin family protein n=1 Tax=Falsiroseomonas tokyonensis TaxID=430521 RepID=A0ABV7C3T0_9PROT|nr:class II aldolase/adducin family protein [Falsiroseomonas tokyonensis]MBU8541290.1 class II aldolase/adducin family protein [Falsiroseomonas tokyonensis]
MSEAALKQDLLHAYHILDADGQASGIAGHLTARLPGADRFWSHRWGIGFDEVRAEGLIEADFDLRTIRGEGRVNPTLHIHTRIYRARPDVACIIHTHGKAGVALGCAGMTLETITQTGAIFHDDIALFDEFHGIVLDTNEGDAIAAALGGKRGLLLKNHGALVVGANVAEACIGMTVLEWAADVQLRAAAAGPLQHLDPAAAAQSKRFLLDPKNLGLRWDFLKRKIGRSRPFLGDAT